MHSPASVCALGGVRPAHGDALCGCVDCGSAHNGTDGGCDRADTSARDAAVDIDADAYRATQCAAEFVDGDEAVSVGVDMKQREKEVGDCCRGAHGGEECQWGVV